MALGGNYTEEAPTSTFDLHRLGPDRLLTLVAGGCAIGFGLLSLVLLLAGETDFRALPGYTPVGSAVFAFAVSVVFGLGLLLAYTAMEKRPAEGAVLALAFSVVLLAFGGMPGLVGGVLGLVGALVGITRNLKFAA